MTDVRTRRDVLGIGAGAIAAGALAGCLGSSTNSGNASSNNSSDDRSSNSSNASASTTASNSPLSTATLSMVGDFTSAVAGDAAGVNRLVPIGTLGHGWSPSSKIQAEVFESDLFVHFNLHAWSSKIATNIESGGSNSTAVVNAQEGIELLTETPEINQVSHGPGNGNESGNGAGYSTGAGNQTGIATFEIVDPDTEDGIAIVHNDHWHGSLPEVPLGGTVSVSALIKNKRDETIELGDEYTLNVAAQSGSGTFTATDSSNDTIQITGEQLGKAVISFQVERGNNVVYETPSIIVEVVGETEQGGEQYAGITDPHFWLDPQRSKRAVENIRDGFVTIDEENAETYEENAQAYIEKLDELDQRFASTLNDAPKDTVLIAGHDAYSYLGHKYDFNVEALTSISPDDQPTPQDIANAQELIEEHDIEYILASVFESDRAATQLVKQTDAKEVLSITTTTGTTREWQQKNWGYIELMEKINLPTLKKALGAE